MPDGAALMVFLPDRVAAEPVQQTNRERR